jgi:hypothetical protein
MPDRDPTPMSTVSNFFENLEIFASQGVLRVSTTQAADFATSFASVVDTPVSMTPVANNGNNIKLLRPLKLDGKNVSIG